MSMWIKAFIGDLLMFTFLALAIMGEGWAQNIVLFMSWVAGGVFIICALGHDPAKWEDRLDEFKAKNNKVWLAYDIFTDLAWVFGLASMGWFWTAGVFIAGIACKGSLREKTLKHFGVKPVSL